MNNTEPQKKYISPEIKLIQIDNEISLALQSNENPPVFESININSAVGMILDPFK